MDRMPASPSSPRARRLRAAATKRRMWEASHSPASQADQCTASPSPAGYVLHNAFCFTQDDYIRIDAALNVLSCRLASLEASLIIPSWSYEPFPFVGESLQGNDSSAKPLGVHSSCQAVVFGQDSIVSSCESYLREVDLIKDTASTVHQNLETLNESLSRKLYEPDCLANYENCFIPSKECSFPVQCSNMDMETISDVGVFFKHLRQTKDNSTMHLEFLTQAARIAGDIEKHVLTIDELNNEDTDSLPMYLMEQYRFRVPAGIEERLRENEEIEAQLAAHELDAIVQYLGSLFVFNLPHYLQYLEKVPSEARRELKQVVKTVIILGGRQSPAPVPDFIQCFDECNAEAFQWQEEISDEDLIRLLTLFRDCASKIV